MFGDNSSYYHCTSFPHIDLQILGSDSKLRKRQCSVGRGQASHVSLGVAVKGDPTL